MMTLDDAELRSYGLRNLANVLSEPVEETAAQGGVSLIP